MKDVISFLAQLQVNNDREWFNAHKDDYRAAQARFNEHVEAVIAGIAGFDESVSGLQVKDCTYRIYRDTRFSNDKRPYKCHMGAFICPGGKKSGMAGYYFQVGPDDEGYDAGNMLASGHYCIEPAALRVLREDIAYGGGDFDAAVKAAKGFVLDDESKLKRVPNGYPKDSEWADYLKFRTYCLVKSPGSDYALRPGLLGRVLEDFRATKPFLDFVNRAIAYSRNPD